MKIEEVIKLILKFEITLNQFFILYCTLKRDNESLRSYIEQQGDFKHFEIQDLVNKGLIINEIEGNKKGIMLSSLSTTPLFQKSLKTPLKQESDVSNWIDEWYDLFPKGIKSGGYYVKTGKKGCEKKLRKFMIDYPEYDSYMIIEATKLYISQMENQGYSKMKLAPNFIDKDNVSILSGYCEQLISKQSLIEEDWNKIKV